MGSAHPVSRPATIFDHVDVHDHDLHDHSNAMMLVAGQHDQSLLMQGSLQSASLAMQRFFGDGSPISCSSPIQLLWGMEQGLHSEICWEGCGPNMG